jgi:coatomer subunit beta'
MTIKPDYKLTGLFGGCLLCVKSKDFIVFYDWKTAKVIRRIDISPTKVIWDDDNSTKVALVAKDGTFLLKFDPN